MGKIITRQQEREHVKVWDQIWRDWLGRRYEEAYGLLCGHCRELGLNEPPPLAYDWHGRKYGYSSVNFGKGVPRREWARCQSINWKVTIHGKTYLVGFALTEDDDYDIWDSYCTAYSKDDRAWNNPFRFTDAYRDWGAFFSSNFEGLSHSKEFQREGIESDARTIRELLEDIIRLNPNY